MGGSIRRGFQAVGYELNVRVRASLVVLRKVSTFNFLLAASLLGFLPLVASVTAGQDPISDNGAIHIPVTMWQKNINGIRKPRVNIGIGNLQPLPVGLDTGSSGLHVFADAN